ncbi:MAG: BamA/TamA family outer membrane protein, partial [Marinobacter sp.]|nr:BamA/TamA family outer membrane protein [Marinobacter sp.]
EQDISSYLLDEYGGKVTFGYPTDSITRLNFGFGVTRSNLKQGLYTSQEVQDFIAKEGDSFDNFFLSGSWNRSTLNRGVLPTDGYSQSISLNVAVPGSDLTFYKLSHKTNFYFPLTDNHHWIFRARSDIGYGDGYAGRSQMPFYEHFYAGGFGSVRGYKSNSLGLRATNSQYDLSTPDPFGGNLLTEGSLELITPTPFAGDSRSMRTSVFIDGGQVFDTERGFDPAFGDIRLSAGVSFQWITAVGPLAFSLAKPLNDKPGDDTQLFQFSLGQTF